GLQSDHAFRARRCRDRDGKAPGVGYGSHGLSPNCDENSVRSRTGGRGVPSERRCTRARRKIKTAQEVKPRGVWVSQTDLRYGCGFNCAKRSLSILEHRQEVKCFDKCVEQRSSVSINLLQARRRGTLKRFRILDKSDHASVSKKEGRSKFAPA